VVAKEKGRGAEGSSEAPSPEDRRSPGRPRLARPSNRLAARLPPPKSPEERTSWLARLTTGPERAPAGVHDQIRNLFGEAKTFDAALFDDLEAILLAADVGPQRRVILSVS